jgi:serine/threonine-protein kinase
VHDRGEHENHLWIAMDYVDGLDASQLMTDRYPAGMPADEVAGIVTAVASALDYAHKRGLLHRDVKPANIMVTHPDDDERRILLTDFGIARPVDDSYGLTTTNMTLGTVAYAAPEQLMGEEIDGRADQYALAATTYHLLTGVPPYLHTNPAVVISKHLSAPPPVLGQVKPELALLDPVLVAALAKDPNQRFSRCTDFARALTEQLSIHAPKPSAPTAPASITPRQPSNSPAEGEMRAPPARRARSNRWMVAIAAGVAAIVVAGGAVILWPDKTSRESTNGADSRSTATSQSGSAHAPSTAVPSPPQKPPVFPAGAINSVLFTAPQLNSLMATKSTNGGDVLELEDSVYGMTDNSNLVTPPNCSGMIFTAEQILYADTGFEAIRHEAFQPNIYSRSGSEPTRVELTVAVYPSGAQAEALMHKAEQQWRSCAAGEVKEFVPPESNRPFIFGPVNLQGGLLIVSMAANSALLGAHACQQVLGVRDNVTVSTRSCNLVEDSPATKFDFEGGTGWPRDPGWASTDAQRLATAMLDKVVY